MNGGAEVEADGQYVRLKAWGPHFDEFVMLTTTEARALALSTLQVVREIEERDKDG